MITFSPSASVNWNDPTTVALLAAEAFSSAGLSHALYGGLLVAAYGEPRETRDADFAVIDATGLNACRAIEATGIRIAITFDQVRFGGLLVSRLTLLGEGKDTGLNTIDLVRPRSARYAAVAVGRALTAPLRDRQVRVLTPEDFVLFKVLSTRDRDLEDAASVLRRTGKLLDRALLDGEMDLLSAEIGDHDIRGRYRALRGRI